MTVPLFCGPWARRDHPIPYTQGQLINVTAVEDLPSAEPLIHSYVF